MSSAGLSVGRVIKVTTSLTPVAAQAANLKSLVIAGDSNVIDTFERMRGYSGLTPIANDFGTNSPEYLAAVPYFSQSPQPTQIFIARWAKASTAGILRAGILTPVQQVIATWQAVVAGNVKIAVDGGMATNVVFGSFAAANNLNAVAVIMQTAIRALGGAFANVSVTWTGSQFVFSSGTTGAASAVAALTAGNANDISAMIKGTAGTLQRIVNGIVAETPVACAAILAAQKQPWYGLTFAAAVFAGPGGSSVLSNADSLAVSDFIEGSNTTNRPHFYCFTHSDPAATVQPDTTSIAYLSNLGGYQRTFYQYSTSNPYAANSCAGRQLVVDYNGNNTVITLAFKQEPTIAPELLTDDQANALDATNNNYFAEFDNNTAIIVNATMAGEFFIDEVLGADWLASQLQTNAYNRLYTSPTKIPQTDPGNHQIATALEAACVQGVNNGLMAPGQWNSQGFGQLAQGDFLPKGFYIYTPPIASQSQDNREARKSVPFQVAAKYAGAIQDVDILLTINR
jgi:hypothetical protein